MRLELGLTDRVLFPKHSSLFECRSSTFVPSHFPSPAFSLYGLSSLRSSVTGQGGGGTNHRAHPASTPFTWASTRGRAACRTRWAAWPSTDPRRLAHHLRYPPLAGFAPPFPPPPLRAAEERGRSRCLRRRRRLRESEPVHYQSFAIDAPRAAEPLVMFCVGPLAQRR